MQNDLELISATGTQIVGVSYDPVEILAKFADQSGITFPLLSDNESQAIRAFGIHHEKGLPHPGTYLIDREGVIREALFLEGYRDRHNSSELIEAAKKIQ